MSLLALAWRYLWARPLATALNLVLMGLGLGSICFVLLAGEQLDRGFERDLAGIDLVVGAKGSPMQIILAGVFHLDVPTGNIALKDVRALERHPMVASLIPLSLGDSYQGFRIVGTSPAYLTHYQMAVAEGAAWSQPMQVLLGADVARDTALAPGSRFAGSHGLAGGPAHEAHAYQVTGVLARCGCVVDRLVLTATESVWETHEHPAAHPAAPAQTDAQEEAREVTVALVRYRTPLAAAVLPRWINTRTGMQAASPAVEVSRLLRMVGVATDIVRGLGAVLLAVATLSVFIALWGAVRDRRADLAMLRLLGATPAKVAGVVITEALWLAVMASLLGLCLGHGLAEIAGRMLQAQHSVAMTGATWLAVEAWIPACALLVALLAASLPVWSAYRVDVARSLGVR